VSRRHAAWAIIICISIITGCLRTHDQPNRNHSASPALEVSASAAPSAIESSPHDPDSGIKHSIEAKPSLFEQTAAAFFYLEQGSDLGNPDEFLRYAMDKLQSLLSYEESSDLSLRDFMKLSPSIRVIDIPEAKWVSYRGQSIVFGESAPVHYSFLQLLHRDHPEAYPLFYADTRQLEIAIGIGNDRWIVSGTEAGGRPTLSLSIPEKKDKLPATAMAVKPRTSSPSNRAKRGCRYRARRSACPHGLPAAGRSPISKPRRSSSERICCSLLSRDLRQAPSPRSAEGGGLIVRAGLYLLMEPASVRYRAPG
jgi:hypothetical protein